MLSKMQRKSIVQLVKNQVMSINSICFRTDASWGFGPEIAETTGNLTVPMGRDAVLTCSVTHLGGHKVAISFFFQSKHLSNRCLVLVTSLAHFNRSTMIFDIWQYRQSWLTNQLIITSISKACIPHSITIIGIGLAEYFNRNQKKNSEVKKGI